MAKGIVTYESHHHQVAIYGEMGGADSFGPDRVASAHGRRKAYHDFVLAERLLNVLAKTATVYSA